MPDAIVISIGRRRRRKPGKRKAQGRSAPEQMRVAVMDEEDTEQLIETLRGDERIVVAGGPDTGKSFFSEKAAAALGLELRSGDAVKRQLEDEGMAAREIWSESSRRVATWLNDPGKWLIEGVVTPRALDHWMDDHPEALVPTTVVWFRDPVKKIVNPHHQTMIKGTRTIWSRVMPRLLQRGARIVERDR